MSTENEVRRLAAATREAAVASFDVEAGLADLRATARGRRHSQVLGTLLATAVVIVATVLLFPGPSRQDPSPGEAPMTRPSPTSSGPRSSGERECDATPSVRCVGPRSFLVDVGVASYEVELPRGFSTDPGLVAAPRSIDFFQDAPGSHAGFTILLGGITMAGASGLDGPTDALGLADSVAALPFLAPASARPTTVSGVPAWTIDTRWAAGVKPPRPNASCNGAAQPCRPVLFQQRPGRSWEMGIWEDMVGSFTFVDLPHGDVAALWSWSFGQDDRALAANDRLLNSLVFSPPA